MGPTPKEKENLDPKGRFLDMDDQSHGRDVDLSLLEPLSLHSDTDNDNSRNRNRNLSSPPMKKSLTYEARSLLDYLSQDDASTLI